MRMPQTCDSVYAVQRRNSLLRSATLMGLTVTARSLVVRKRQRFHTGFGKRTISSWSRIVLLEAPFSDASRHADARRARTKNKNTLKCCVLCGSRNHMAAKSLKIDSLDLDLENPRITLASDQRDAMQKILNEQKARLINLAESIAVKGFSPMDRCLILRSHIRPGKFIVLEGNRRVLCAKLLKNP